MSVLTLSVPGHGVQRDASEQVTELQNRLTAHESDLSRLRASRDELRAESAELRAKESGNSHSLDELRKLAEARKVRLQAYASELRRIRLGKAAERGDVENVDVRLKQAETAEEDEFEEGEVQVGEDEVVTDLSNRLKKAEGLLLALRDQLHSYAGSAGGLAAPSAQHLVDSETRARADLADAHNRVVKLEAILGPGGRADVREMAERLEEKTRELKVAQAQVKSQEAVRAPLRCDLRRSCSHVLSCRPQTCSTARLIDSRRHGRRSTSRMRPRCSTSQFLKRSCSV